MKKTMTTFERVKRNILRDMESTTSHNADSWARIMLTNTARLTNIEEQKLFWAWIQNPMDEEREPPLCEIFDNHSLEDIPRFVTVQKPEEKGSVELEQTVTRNGASMFIQVKPIQDEKSDS
jgi:hypothetical protein